MVRIPGFQLPWPRIQSLVKEQRSHRLHGMAKKQNKQMYTYISIRSLTVIVQILHMGRSNKREPFPGP